MTYLVTATHLLDRSAADKSVVDSFAVLESAVAFGKLLSGQFGRVTVSDGDGKVVWSIDRRES